MMVISFRRTCESVWIIIVNCASMFAYPSARTFFLVFLTIAYFFETTSFPKCRVDTSLLFFSREGRKRGERHDRGGRGNVPELSASVRQSQFIPKPTNNLSKFLAGRGRESSRQHSLICIQNKDVWTRHGAGKIVRRHWCTCIES